MKPLIGKPFTLKMYLPETMYMWGACLIKIYTEKKMLLNQKHVYY